MTQELIARIEAATGPDRELDAETYLASVASKNIRALAEVALACAGNESRGEWLTRMADEWGVDPYTASIDAALTLVPENHTVDLTIGSHWPNRARLLLLYQDGDRWLHRGSDPHFCSNAATPALALCAAALKARKARP